LPGRLPICAAAATSCPRACSGRSKPGARRRRHAPRFAARWARSSSQPVIPSCDIARRPRQPTIHPRGGPCPVWAATSRVRAGAERSTRSAAGHRDRRMGAVPPRHGGASRAGLAVGTARRFAPLSEGERQPRRFANPSASAHALCWQGVGHMLHSVGSGAQLSLWPSQRLAVSRGGKTPRTTASACSDWRPKSCNLLKFLLTSLSWPAVPEPQRTPGSMLLATPPSRPERPRACPPASAARRPASLR
jgi:hypothetical protein